jgi:GEVED domain
MAALSVLAAAPGVGALDCPCPAIYVGDIPGIDPTVPPRINPVCIGLVAPDKVNPITGKPITIPSAVVAVTKSITRVDNNDGTATFAITLTGPIPAAVTTIDVFDCVWIDVNGNGLFDQGESMRAYEGDKATVQGAGSRRTVDFTLTVPNAAGRTVCDQAAGVNFSGLTGTITSQTGIESGSWIQAITPSVCSEGGAPAVVPEATFVPSLLASALAGLGIGWFAMRRRRLATVPMQGVSR